VTRRTVGLLVALVVLAAAWGLVLLAFIGGPLISSGTGVPMSEPDRAARTNVYFEFLLHNVGSLVTLYAVGLVLIVMSVLLVRRALARRRSR
jgi:hypothetical protein